VGVERDLVHIERQGLPSVQAGHPSGYRSCGALEMSGACEVLTAGVFGDKIAIVEGRNRLLLKK
jgi:hypothetical protein